MQKTISALGLVLFLGVGQALASGYRIPEQSVNAVALANASVASPQAADTAYSNPANMPWLEKGWLGEMSLTWVNLPSVEYSDVGNSAQSSASRTENFLMPNLHLVSPAYERLRFGFSVIFPFGLSKRWDGALPRTTAEDFTLQTVELNPTLSYQINETFALAGGLRILRADGEVRSQGLIGGALWRRDLEGDSLGYGYNLALSYRPLPGFSLAATYRSKIDLDLEGDAVLAVNGIPLYKHRAASVVIPAPAVLTLASAFTFGKNTFEFAYDKTYWDAYRQLDFNYDQPLAGISPVLGALFDDPVRKSWHNTDAFRFGLTHQLRQNLSLMAGFAIDKNPIPDDTLGFDLPDSDARLYSFGFRYRPTPDLMLGAAYLYDDKDERAVVSPNPLKPNGSFSNSAAHLLSLGAQYRF